MDPRINFETFRDDVFLSRQVLNDQNVMEYFYSSQFFDTSSLNQKQRRGVQFALQDEGILYRLAFAKDTPPHDAQLSSSEFFWNYSNQLGVFIIQKLWRDAKEIETPLDCFYILGGTIYKAPSLGALIRRRCCEVVTELDHLIDSTLSMSSWSLIEGYTWKKTDDPCFTNKNRIDTTTSISKEPLHATVQASASLINDIYTKRPCSDTPHIIENAFRNVIEARRLQDSAAQIDPGFTTTIEVSKSETFPKVEVATETNATATFQGKQQVS